MVGVQAVPNPAAARYLDLPLRQFLPANLPIRQITAESMMAFVFNCSRRGAHELPRF